MKKNNIIIKAATLALIMLAALLLSLRLPISPAGVAGVLTILVLLAIVSLEYRPVGKDLIKR